MLKGMVATGVLAVAAVGSTVSGNDSTSTAEAVDPLVVWTVGDICDKTATARCAQVADVIAADPTRDLFVTLGDNQYDNATLSEFKTYYHPHMGSKLNTITKPTVGNHEYYTKGAAGYFDYFGAKAGDRSKGYYSFVDSGWKMIVANTNCSVFGDRCYYASTQGKWLDAQLSAAETCEIVFGHHPPITDGNYAPGVNGVKPFFRHAVENKAEWFITSHDHAYQRFGPMDASLLPNPNGVPSLVVGTGGRSLYPFGSTNRSEARATKYGAVRMELTPGAYKVEMIALDGTADGTVIDTKTGTCN